MKFTSWRMLGFLNPESAFQRTLRRGIVAGALFATATIVDDVGLLTFIPSIWQPLAVVCLGALGTMIDKALGEVYHSS